MGYWRCLSIKCFQSSNSNINQLFRSKNKIRILWTVFPKCSFSKCQLSHGSIRIKHLIFFRFDFNLILYKNSKYLKIMCRKWITFVRDCPKILSLFWLIISLIFICRESNHINSSPIWGKRTVYFDEAKTTLKMRLFCVAVLVLVFCGTVSNFDVKEIRINFTLDFLFEKSLHHASQ